MLQGGHLTSTPMPMEPCIAMSTMAGTIMITTGITMMIIIMTTVTITATRITTTGTHITTTATAPR